MNCKIALRNILLITLLALVFVFMWTNFFLPPSFSDIAEAEEENVDIPMGYGEFPELKANPDKTDRDMIKRDDYRDLPIKKFSFLGLTNRKAVWLVAQLHILFASFILGVPLFVIISEILYWKTHDERYEKLAKEITKLVVMCSLFTVVTGCLFVLFLVAFYPTFTTWMFRGFNNLMTFWYPVLFLIETSLLYLYYYLWDYLNKVDKKGLHIFIGVLLNIAGILLLIVMNAPATFMQTPPQIDGSIKGIATFGEWAWINNFTWWPLNYHRLLGNLVLGGYIVGFLAAYKYIFSSDEEERAYYDWQGYLGNTLGFAFLFLMPITGFNLSKKLYMYDPAIGMYIMSDRLSMFFVVEAVLVCCLFIGSSYYIWLSMRRIVGGEKYLKWIRWNFAIMVVCAAIWATPRHFFATMVPEPGMIPAGMEKKEFLEIVELPDKLALFALMKVKNYAASVLVFLTFVNYIFYRVAVRKGRIVFGKIHPIAQYVLVFLAFTQVWFMCMMGAIRSLARKNYHVYRVFKDMTSEAYTPTLQTSAILTTEITLVFFFVLVMAVWLQPKVFKLKKYIYDRNTSKISSSGTH